MSRAVIVADLGTSAVKSYLYDLQSGEMLAESRMDVPLNVPEAGAAENDPSLWWEGFCRTVKAILQERPECRVEAVTLTNQQISCVFLDEFGQPVAPAYLWLDTRCTSEIERLRQQCRDEGTGTDWIFETTGIPPSDSWGLAKLLWFKRKDPEAFRRVRKIASVDAYLFRRLSGRLVSDETNACFFNLDIRTRKPADRLLNYLQLDPGLFPETVPAGSLVGRVSAEAARETELPEDLPVIAAASDQPCAVLGMGVIRPGEAVVNLGTGSFILTPSDSPLTDPRLMTNISAVQGRWLMMGTHYLTGGALSWLRGLFASQGSGLRFSDMDDLAERVPPGSEGLVFLPGLSGTGTPNWDPEAKGMFAGLGLGHSVGHLARAVMESTGYGIRGILETFASIGVPIERLVVSGGPAVSAVWRQAIADIVQRPLERSMVKEATPLGAAMLAAVAMGRFADIPQAIREWSQPGTSIVPQEENRTVYDRAYASYLAWLDAETSVRAKMGRNC